MSQIRDAFIENANKNEVAALALSADSAASQKQGVFLSIRDSDLKKPLKNASRPGMPGRRQGPPRESSATRAIGDAFRGPGKRKTVVMAPLKRAHDERLDFSAVHPTEVRTVRNGLAIAMT
jgi:hypothetical protein